MGPERQYNCLDNKVSFRHLWVQWLSRFRRMDEDNLLQLYYFSFINFEKTPRKQNLAYACSLLGDNKWWCQMYWPYQVCRYSLPKTWYDILDMSWNPLIFDFLLYIMRTLISWAFETGLGPTNKAFQNLISIFLKWAWVHQNLGFTLMPFYKLLQYVTGYRRHCVIHRSSNSVLQVPLPSKVQAWFPSLHYSFAIVDFNFALQFVPTLWTYSSLLSFMKIWIWH